MKPEDHARAKQLLIADKVEGISAPDRRWLDTHLVTCDACSNEAVAVTSSVATLRSISITAPDDVVRRTRLAVQRRAEELQSRRESAAPIWIAVAMTTIWGILLTPYMWSLFAWMGPTSQLSAFLMWWFLPATVLAGVAAWRSSRRTEAI
jgi:hypothetical protein